MKMLQISRKVLKDKPGIYCIKNIVSKKTYVGQTINIYKRLIGHRHRLKSNKHSNDHLQKSFNKHGIEKFEILILEYCNVEDLEKNEIKYINIQDECYNIRGVETSSRGYKRKPPSDKSRKLMSDAKKGKTPENFKQIKENQKRKIKYYMNNKLIKIFNSCKEAAEYFGMKPNVFHEYIGKSRKSKYFSNGYKLEYYD